MAGTEEVLSAFMGEYPQLRQTLENLTKACIEASRAGRVTDEVLINTYFAMANLHRANHFLGLGDKGSLEAMTTWMRKAFDSLHALGEPHAGSFLEKFPTTPMDGCVVGPGEGW